MKKKNIDFIAVVENNTGIEIEPLFEELLSAIHNVNGEEN